MIECETSIAPRRFAPVHGRKPNGDVDTRPWCRGLDGAKRLRLAAWAATRHQQHTPRLLLPILLHCVDKQGRPLLGPSTKGRETEEFLRNAPADIPDVVEGMHGLG